ncbi:MAG: sulfatase [Candidatus Brocadiia bacterium]
MRRRQFLHMMAAGAAARSVGRFLPPALAQKGEQPVRNVLFIAVDDLRPELGCYGDQQARSPHIDKLAARGLLFERAYVQQAVCAPSRASLLTGTRPDTTGIYHLRTPVRKAMPEVLTLPQHFRQNGYETVSLGKIYHHWNDDNGIGWSVDAWHPRGPWEGRGYRSEAALEAMRRRDATDPRKKGIGPPVDDADVPDNGYRDGATADKAIQELRRLKDKPFFLAVGFLKPHLPFNAPKKYWDLYRRQDIQLPARRDWPDDMPRIAGMNWGELRQYVGIPSKGNLDEDQARELIHGYYACVSYMDAQVGRVLGELGRLGLDRNTIVVLWGDHGWKLGEYSAWCKHTNFELDTHAPLILSVPGQKTAGQSTPALVEFVDIYPTLCEAAGLPLPDHLEGTSMRPLLEDPQRPWKTAAFSQYPRGQVMGYTMRTDRYRYTAWIHRKTKKVVARELYDHQAGPLETVNLAGRPEHKATVEKLHAMLEAGWQAARPQT